MKNLIYINACMRAGSRTKGSLLQSLRNSAKDTKAIEEGLEICKDF